MACCFYFTPTKNMPPLSAGQVIVFYIRFSSRAACVINLLLNFFSFGKGGWAHSVLLLFEFIFLVRKAACFPDCEKPRLR